MICSERLTIGAAFRKRWMIRLDELDIPYTEHRSFVDSVIIVKVYSKEQEAAYNVFMAEYMAFVQRLLDIDLEIEREELARKNRFRRLTFRKPLRAL
jgi:hypothetical protein